MLISSGEAFSDRTRFADSCLNDEAFTLDGPTGVEFEAATVLLSKPGFSLSDANQAKG